jgi:hypothetical protein
MVASSWEAATMSVMAKKNPRPQQEPAPEPSEDPAPKQVNLRLFDAALLDDEVV